MDYKLPLSEVIAEIAGNAPAAPAVKESLSFKQEKLAQKTQPPTIKSDIASVLLKLAEKLIESPPDVTSERLVKVARYVEFTPTKRDS